MKRYRIMLLAVLLTLVGRTLADNLAVDGVTLSVEQSKQVEIVLKNPSHQYAGFQFDLVLPEGVSIAKNAKGKLDAKLSMDRADDHTLNVQLVGDNTYRFLSFSLSNAEFYGTDGTLVYVTLQTAEDVVEGAKMATFKSQVFTEVSGDQYKWDDTSFLITVEKAVIPVKVTAKSYIREYGEANPTFEFTTEGATLDGEPVIECAATATSPVGTYPIVIRKGSVKNYNDTYVNGTLTITKAPLTISAGNYTKKQGESMPEFKPSYSGFKNGESSDVLKKQPTVSCEATEASEPGEYDVTVSGAEADNYDISYLQGHLTVVDADAIVITAKSYTREYGDANPTFEFTTEGATLEGKPVIECAATATSPVGTYPIVIRKGSVKNYNDTYVNGTLTITKAPLTISAGNYTKKQGEAMPEFKPIYSGFKNGESSAVLKKQPTVSCEATEASAPGEYDVTVSGAEADNYSISYQQGKLTVTTADPITLTATSYTREYGEANPVFGFTTEGATLEGKPVIECAATATSPVGTYPIVIRKGSVKNYNDTYVNGTLTITKAPLTVSVVSCTREQLQENPEFMVVYSGWKNDENESVLQELPIATTTATKESPAGEYSIVVSGGKAQNYEMDYINGILTVIEPAAIKSLTADNTYFDVYTLDGRIIRKRTTTLKGLVKGVYVVNGKKIILK